MSGNIKWNAREAAIFILSLEGEIANLLFMLLKNRLIDIINDAMDNVGIPNDEEKGEVILTFSNMLNARLLNSKEGKEQAISYLKENYQDTTFIDELIKDRELSNVSALEIETEMEILSDTVVKNLSSKSFIKSIDNLRAKLVKSIVEYPVDSAMVLSFLLAS